MINNDKILQLIQADIALIEPGASKRLYYIKQRKRLYMRHYKRKQAA